MNVSHLNEPRPLANLREITALPANDPKEISQFNTLKPGIYPSADISAGLVSAKPQSMVRLLSSNTSIAFYWASVADNPG